MKTETSQLDIEFIDEPTYTFGSTDNLRSYPIEWLDGTGQPVSSHGILIEGKPFAVIGAFGGATGVHENSMLQLNGIAYFAVGDQVVSFDLIQKEKKWNQRIDDATCFGIYYSKQHDALISHGELLISRFSPEGRVIWQSAGRDIFTEGFSLLDDCIHTTDFEGNEYRFSYEDGKEK
ncbi:hypothetical protein [Pelagicoccus sp. SDUM812005]|uniref:hypothetical protein n=1 Tax=Pelagicoccus sp. SDUM812005 TaxID=3041257 RepID=UPI00280F25B8|nr:hypothetical protein [Pelagicoccus sp. SDUM812005]MDQ8181875.1 hypothetical protein [Pelagicoccus sp. SDUM812005]